MRRALATLASLLVGGAALACGRGCSSSPGAQQQQQPVVDTGTDSPFSLGDGATVCPSTARPAGVPDGWEVYDGAPGCCGLYLPTGVNAELPPPITWESCGPNLLPVGAVCQRMKIDWRYPTGAPPMAYRTNGATDRAGNIWLGFDRVESVPDSATAYFIYRLIANANAGIAHAILETESTACTLGTHDLDSDRYVYTLNEYSVDKGFATGPVNAQLPDSTMTFKTGTHNQAVGPVGVLDIDDGFRFNLYPPLGFNTSSVIWSSAQDKGLDESFPFFSADALFWTASRDWYQKIHVYTPTGGTKDFIASDPSLGKSAGDFGTDGIDMVWVEGGEPDGGATTGTYPPASIMTAPYTTNPAAVVKRRLTTEPDGATVGADNFVVGCGYAARDMYDRIRLVRISDGQSWMLTPNSTNSNIWSWMSPLVLTCDEMFAYITGDGIANIARVRLDSLGPGDPAN